MKKIKIGLLARIVIAIILGIAIGTVFPAPLVRIFVTFNGIFSEFLNFSIPLIIVGLVTVAIADIGKGAGKMLLVTALIAYFATLFSGFLSYFTGVTVFPSLIEPGAPLEEVSEAQGILPYFSVSIPPLMNVMTALVLAFTLGLGLASLNSDALKNVARDFQEIIVRMISAVILPLLPLYIFGIFLNMTHSGQVYSILMVFIKIIGVIFVLHIFLLVFQYSIAALFVHRNPFKLLSKMLPAYFTALGTQSSAATIPVTLEQTKKNGVSAEVAGFVIPLCATIHLSGSTLKIVACALALMMMQGMPFDFPMFAGFIFMLGINPWITLIVVILSPMSFLVANFISRKSFTMFKKQSETRGELTGFTNEMLGGILLSIHNLHYLIDLMRRAREAVLADLNEFFEKAPADMHWNAYYNHANEPVHLVPFLFNRLGEPWSTQRWTRFICRQAYADKVEGIVGNEDAGQMSAWYVLAAAGIHPACPGDTRMEITSPVFDRIEFRLDPRYAQGGTFAVVAHGNSPENIYIQRAVLNGEELAASHIDFAQIAAGGTLELYMGPEPNRQWGIDKPTER